VTPYYDQDGVTIYHADAREVADWLAGDVLVTDPPYGIGYSSGKAGTLPRSIEGDEDVSLRDWALDAWGERPALVFGSWRRPRPTNTRALLVWDTKGALGMGALDIPWKPAHQEVYVLGRGFTGRRGTDVLTFAPVQAMAENGRVHPHEKPVELMRALIAKCPPGVVVDPFAGSGTTLRAAKDMGRRAIGIEVDERYCEIAARRLGQGVLDLDDVCKEDQ
jgi:DNA modification methylase